MNNKPSPPETTSFDAYIRSQLTAARDAALKGNAALAADICESALQGLARMKEAP